MRRSFIGYVNVIRENVQKCGSSASRVRLTSTSTGIFLPTTRPIKMKLQIPRDVKHCSIRAISRQIRDVKYCSIRAMSQVSCDVVTYCRDRGYLTTHVTSLPRLCHLSDSTPRAFVNYARTDQLDEMKRMILLAEERGDNVGKGEFTTECRRTNYLFNRSEVFAVTLDNKSTSSGTASLAQDQGHGQNTEVDAFIAISPCLYARTYDPCLATVRVFRSPRLAADDHAYRSLVNLAVQLTDEINCGYTHAVVDVALCHVNLLRKLKDERFHVTAIIPDNVYVNGVGACDNVILAKHFRKIERPIRSLEAVLEMLERVDPCTEFLESYPTMELPQLTFLPQRYTFSNGVETIVRNMRKEEDETMFSVLEHHIKKGLGYGVHEYPSLNYFRKNRLATSYTMVIDDAKDNKMIGFGNIIETPYSRGWHTPWMSSTNLNPGYRGKGMGADFVTIQFCIGIELRVDRVVPNTFLSNTGLKSAVTNSVLQPVHIGVIPSAGFLQGAGCWEDVLLIDLHMGKMPTFSKLVEENRKRFSSSTK